MASYNPAGLRCSEVIHPQTRALLSQPIQPADVIFATTPSEQAELRQRLSIHTESTYFGHISVWLALLSAPYHQNQPIITLTEAGLRNWNKQSDTNVFPPHSRELTHIVCPISLSMSNPCGGWVAGSLLFSLNSFHHFEPIAHYLNRRGSLQHRG